jgi:6-pyruvoyltetrahydropterin/6-carboxytetrahydropterin synthase
MSIIRISKEFTFEMAHALRSYQGKCAGLHGHSYHLTVTVVGKAGNETDDPLEGMVMDFGDLKRIVGEKILHVFDHAVVLNEKDPLCQQITDGPSRLIKTKYQPTCENLLADIAERIQSSLFHPVRLFSLKLRETSTCYAEWFASDNMN